MSPSIVNTKQIAKNTLFLYIRTIFVLLVTLYTSRVVLHSLGIVDHGIYNVVGGVIYMIGFLNASMAQSTQRFLSYELGKGGDSEQFNLVYNSCVQVHCLIAVAFLVICETVGLWFVSYQLNVPADRRLAMHVVYQSSVIAMFLTILIVPYYAAIISHERMHIYAYVSIADAVLKLLVAIFIPFIKWDSLIIYAILIAVAHTAVQLFYIVYCKLEFKNLKLHLRYEPKLIKKVFSFSGWTITGSLVWVLITQGVNMLLNIFFGPVVNSARAIAVQVQSAVTQFATYFQVAVNPQITKSYAAGELSQCHKLVILSAKYSLFLLLFFAIPTMADADRILSLWLTIVPDHTTNFVRLVLITATIDSTANSLMILAGATGKIKRYQLVLSCILILILPIAYILLKLGFPPESVFVVHIGICVIAMLARIQMVSTLAYLPKLRFAVEVLIRGLAVALSALIVIVFFKRYVEVVLPISIILNIIIVSVSILVVGVTRSELRVLISRIRGVRKHD